MRGGDILMRERSLGVGKMPCWTPPSASLDHATSRRQAASVKRLQWISSALEQSDSMGRPLASLANPVAELAAVHLCQQSVRPVQDWTPGSSVTPPAA